MHPWPGIRNLSEAWADTVNHIAKPPAKADDIEPSEKACCVEFGIGVCKDDLGVDLANDCARAKSMLNRLVSYNPTDATGEYALEGLRLFAVGPSDVIAFASWHVFLLAAKLLQPVVPIIWECCAAFPLLPGGTIRLRATASNDPAFDTPGRIAHSLAQSAAQWSVMYVSYKWYVEHNQFCMQALGVDDITEKMWVKHRVAAEDGPDPVKDLLHNFGVPHSKPAKAPAVRNAAAAKRFKPGPTGSSSASSSTGPGRS